jgi:hypothetical protein
VATTDVEKTSFEEASSWAKFLPEMNALAERAITRGVDPDMARYLAGTAAMQKSVMAHNARAMGRAPHHYASFEEFVLTHGQSYEPPKKPRPKGFRKGRDKQCFSNATDAVIWREGFRYVEGFGTATISCHHAWVLDQDGNVIETTWKDAGSAYVGVEFPEEVMREATYLKGTYGVFCETLLEEPYDPEHPEAFIERLKTKPQRQRRW